MIGAAAAPGARGLVQLALPGRAPGAAESPRLSPLSAMAATPGPGLLTAAEVAAMLRCDESTVYRLGLDGYLERVRVGPRMVRFAAASVAELVANGAKAGAA